MASRVFVLGACLMAWLDSGSMAIRSAEDADEQGGAHLMPEVGHQEDEHMEAIHTLGLNRTKDCSAYFGCIENDITSAAVAACKSVEACIEAAKKLCEGTCETITEDDIRPYCDFQKTTDEETGTQPTWSVIAAALQEDKCVTCPAAQLEEMCNENKVADTEVQLKVATLNCLEVGLSSSTPAGLATKNRKWVDAKDTNKSDPTWLTLQLNKFWDDGFALVSLQEVDQPSDLSKSENWNYAQLYHEAEKKLETAYLAWHPQKLERTPTEPENYPKTGLMMFEFKVKESGKKIKVMAGHADSSPPCSAKSNETCWGDQEKIITAMSPDIVMVDANQDAATALKAYGDNYDVYPSDPKMVTSMKVVYKYRKLAQALENTRFFEYLKKGTTCEQLKCKDGNTAGCCQLTEDSERDFKMGSFDVTQSEELISTCQYASRVCGGYDIKTAKEVVELLGLDESLQRDEDKNYITDEVAEAAKMLDLTKIKELISYDNPNLSWNKKKGAQEDLIIYKKSTVGFASGEVCPSFDNKDRTEFTLAYWEKGKEEGFPNTVWPSDHFLVKAEVTV